MRFPDWLQNSFDRIPVSDRPEFLREIIFTNYSRAKIMIWFLLCWSLAMIYLLQFQNIFQISSDFRSIATGVDIIIFILCGLFAWLFSQANLKQPTESNAHHLYLLRGFEAVCFVFINFTVLMSLLGLKVIYPYVLGTLGAPVIFYFPNPFSLILLLASYLFCILSIAFIAPNQVDLYIPATAAVILSALFAHLLLQSRVEDFLNRKMVMQQAQVLQELNVELNHRNQELSQLNQEKNEFLGIAAHDLKNPLAAIKGSAELLLNLPNLERTKLEEFLHRIIISSARMKDLISNLLDVNAIERGEVRYTMAACNCVDLAENVLKSYQQAAFDKDQQLLFQPKTSIVMVWADPLILTQILDNLISNAVKYSPLGKPIQVTIEVISDRGRCSIRDEGPGLSLEDQQKLFGKFARLSPLPTGGEHSTGLGLSIVKRLVELLQGRVWCESELGHGSVFILELPILKP